MTCRWLLTAAAVVAVAFGTGSAQAMYCGKPDEPWCISRYGTFEDDDAFQRCRREVRDYVDEMKSYVDCLRLEQTTSIDEANAVVERFNCKAKGGTFC